MQQLPFMYSKKHMGFSPKIVAEFAELAQKLLGNVSTNISAEWCHKATPHPNPQLVTFIDNEDIFENAVPLLIGKLFD